MIPYKSVHVRINPKKLSTPGSSSCITAPRVLSVLPSPIYRLGLPPHLRNTTRAADTRVLTAKSRKPAKFVRPRTPAVAPENTAVRNLMVNIVDRLLRYASLKLGLDHHSSLICPSNYQ